VLPQFLKEVRLATVATSLADPCVSVLATALAFWAFDYARTYITAGDPFGAAWLTANSLAVAVGTGPFHELAARWASS